MARSLGLARNRLRRGIGGGGAAVAPILRFSDGVFTRSGEGSSYLTGPPNTTGGFLAFAGANVLREDKRDGRSGLYLFEMARTNLALWNEDLTNGVWTLSGATLNGTATTAPDGGACDIVSMSAAGDEVRQAISGTSATTYYTSCWVRHRTGTGAVRIAYTLRDGTTPVTSDLPISQTWTRVRDRRAWGTGATTPTVAIRNAAAGGSQEIEVWGLQVEQDLSGYTTSVIRTEGSAVTRPVDLLTFSSVPAALRSGAFYIDVSPTEANLNGIVILAYASGANDRLEFRTTSPFTSMQLASAAQYGRGAGITFPADQVVRVTCDQAAATLAISGATTGDGTGSAGTPVSFADGFLSVGNRNGINGTSVRIGEPYAP